MEEALRQLTCRRGGAVALVVWLVAGLIALPVGIGIAGVALPAFGYLPALGGEGFSLEPFRRLAAEPGLGDSIALSVVSGLGTTAIALAGVILFVASFAGTRAFALARQALAPLLAVPHAAAAFGLAFLIAPSGLLFRLAAAPLGIDRPPDLLIVGDPNGLAMMAGLIAKEMPFLLLVSFAALHQTKSEERLRLARSLGYGRILGFVLAVWPSVYRQIRLPVLAVAAFASSVVDVALILGPSTPPPLAVRILQWMQDPDLAAHFTASAGALLQLGVTLAVILGWLAMERIGRVICSLVTATGRRLASDAAGRVLAPLPVAVAAGVVFVGLATLAVWSLAGLWTFPDLLPPSLSLDTWRRALGSAAGPLATSLIVALLAALLALFLVVGLVEARRRSASHTQPGAIRLQPAVAGLLYLPLIVPQVSFVFGLQILVLGLDIEPSVISLTAVHLVFVVPYVALALADPWYALDGRYEKVAASLGRGYVAALFQIRLPMLLTPVLTAAAIGFAISIGQYLPTVLIGGGRLVTITTEAVALSSGANPHLIGAYALLQTALPFVAFGLSNAVSAMRARRHRGIRV